MITVNDYFNGKIKSLGFERDGVSYTVGVFLPGEYKIKTEEEEHISVTLGDFEIRLPKGGWKRIELGDKIVIPESTEFYLKVENVASYICTYGKHNLSDLSGRLPKSEK